MSSSKNHFLMIDEIKMRSKKSAGSPKRKNDKPFASDCKLVLLRTNTSHAIAIDEHDINFIEVLYVLGQNDESIFIVTSLEAR
jgi:hypothetical protein